MTSFFYCVPQYILSLKLVEEKGPAPTKPIMSKPVIFPLLQEKLKIIEPLCNSEVRHPLYQALIKLMLVSDYALHHMKVLKKILAENDYNLNYPYKQALALLPPQSHSEFIKSMREFRHYHLLRLLLHEYGGLTNTAQTMRAWSFCADALITHVLDYCQHHLSERYGQPYDQSGTRTRLSVLAMGKLGGQELNFSSDIDLIFVYSEGGKTRGPEIIGNQEYYTKVVQLFIQIMQNPTENGFVFRVDLRLRPFGESGALVSSYSALEAYYQEQGRDWERYAMVKARVIDEPTTDPTHWYNRLIIPFTYRRYIDFSVIDSLRSMKAMIEHEVLINPQFDDIKRGLGGIREIEFIIQNIQLIRGGRLSHLRIQNAMSALNILKEDGLLFRCAFLEQAYFFYRKLENCLQSLNDQQTHRLPEDPFKQSQICYAMNYPDWDNLYFVLCRFKRITRHLFQSILGSVNQDGEQSLLFTQLNSVWQGNIESQMAIQLLASIGFQEAERCYQLIQTFRHSPRCRRLNQTARIRLDRFMSLLLMQLSKISPAEPILLNMIRLLDNIVGRSAYLALLTENPHVVKELLYWFSCCPFITSLIVDQPFLLEFLLNQKSDRLYSRRQLQQQLKILLKENSEIEQQQLALGQFKLRNWLLAARAQVRCHQSNEAVGLFLTNVAQVIVTAVTDLACQQLAKRFPLIEQLKANFAIIAYGRLGSEEMNYHSDLDLVFIHQNSPLQAELMLKLTQRIILLLTTRLQTGVLYAVDTRLRPSGEAGLLLSSFQAYSDYQNTTAWTWEHQALIRARLIVGEALKRKFNRLKQSILLKPRPIAPLQQDFRDMRKKMLTHLNQAEIKFAPGGLMDLDFLIQYFILSHPLPNYYQYTSTLNLLDYLYENEIIPYDQWQGFRETYKNYQHCIYFSLLQGSPLEQWKKYTDFILESLNEYGI